MVTNESYNEVYDPISIEGLKIKSDETLSVGERADAGCQEHIEFWDTHTLRLPSCPCAVTRRITAPGLSCGSRRWSPGKPREHLLTERRWGSLAPSWLPRNAAMKGQAFSGRRTLSSHFRFSFTTAHRRS